MSPTNLVVTILVLAVVGYAHYLHMLELDRRGVWMKGVNNFRAEVQSRTADRWTRQQHDAREKEIWNSIANANPALVIPVELELSQ